MLKNCAPLRTLLLILSLPQNFLQAQHTGLESGDHHHRHHELGTELALAFEMGEHLHPGPSIEAGLVKDDIHLSIGIHIGYIFTPGK